MLQVQRKRGPVGGIPSSKAEDFPTVAKGKNQKKRGSKAKPAGRIHTMFAKQREKGAARAARGAAEVVG